MATASVPTLSAESSPEDVHAFLQRWRESKLRHLALDFSGFARWSGDVLLQAKEEHIIAALRKGNPEPPEDVPAFTSSLLATIKDASSKAGGSDGERKRARIETTPTPTDLWDLYAPAVQAPSFPPSTINGCEDLCKPNLQASAKEAVQTHAQTILPSLIDQTHNHVVDTHQNFYLNGRAPDFSIYPNGYSAVSSRNVISAIEIKPFRNSTYSNDDKGQALDTCLRILDSQSGRQRAAVALTDCFTVLFVEVGLVGNACRATVSEVYPLVGDGGFFLRALLNTPHPTLSFGEMSAIGRGMVATTPLVRSSLSTLFNVHGHPDMVIKVSAPELVYKEVQALSRLNGLPGIIEMVDHAPRGLLLRPVANTNAEHFFELHPGCSRAILAPIVDALRACHERHVLHRDCRCSNILIFDPAALAPRVMLADFGCSCLEESWVDCQTREGAPSIYRSDHLLDSKPGDIRSFRRADDLHIFARALYILKPSLRLPDNLAAPRSLKTFWRTVGDSDPAWSVIFRLCEDGNYDVFNYGSLSQSLISTVRVPSLFVAGGAGMHPSKCVIVSMNIDSSVLGVTLY